MDENKEGGSASATNSTVKDEDIEVEARELTATPLRRYVTMLDNGSSNKWICNFRCKPEPYTGTYSRVRAHLIGLLPGQKSQGIAICPKVSREDREKMKSEHDEAKRVFGGCTRKTPISSAIPVASHVPMASMSMDEGRDGSYRLKVSSKDEVDGSVARFFYGCGIPINIAKSPFWVDMVRYINEAPKGYEPPSSEKIKTTLLDKEKTQVDQELISIKQQWPTYGVSIVSDGWINVKKESFIKVMAVSERSAMFINGLDCTKDDVSSESITEVLLKAIESVGAFNVMQILTNNVPECKAAGRVIEKSYPHIFWSASVAHTVSLLMKDIVKSLHPNLAFLANCCYKKVKEVIDYFSSHSLSLYILRSFPDLDVFQVKKRRYGQHFLLLDRFLQVKNILINMVLSEEWDKIKRGQSKSVLGDDMVRMIILDDDFWSKLKTIVAFMRPMWDLISYCDSEKACIGEVYQRMEDMVETFEVTPLDYSDTRETIKNLVSLLWDKIDVRLYTVAYVLNPYYYSDKWLASLSPGGHKRLRPHARHNVHMVYLDAIDRLLRDSKEASLVRHQLSEFVSNTGSFASPQARKDRDNMSAISWWHLHGASAPELYSLAIKVLSQCVNMACAEREMPTCEYIRGINKNKMNAGRAESFVYIHYNHRLLTRKREDYDGLYRNWDYYVADDNLEVDVEAIEDKECARLYGVETSAPLSHSFSGVAWSSCSQTPRSSKLKVSKKKCKR